MLQHVTIWHVSDILSGANGVNHTIDSKLIHNSYKFHFNTEKKNQNCIQNFSFKMGPNPHDTNYSAFKKLGRRPFFSHAVRAAER